MIFHFFIIQMIPYNIIYLEKYLCLVKIRYQFIIYFRIYNDRNYISRNYFFKKYLQYNPELFNYKFLDYRIQFYDSRIIFISISFLRNLSISSFSYHIS